MRLPGDRYRAGHPRTVELAFEVVCPWSREHVGDALALYQLITGRLTSRRIGVRGSRRDAGEPDVVGCGRVLVDEGDRGPRCYGDRGWAEVQSCACALRHVDRSIHPGAAGGRRFSSRGRGRRCGGRGRAGCGCRRGCRGRGRGRAAAARDGDGAHHPRAMELAFEVVGSGSGEGEADALSLRELVERVFVVGGVGVGRSRGDAGEPDVVRGRAVLVIECHRGSGWNGHGGGLEVQ